MSMATLLRVFDRRIARAFFLGLGAGVLVLPPVLTAIAAESSSTSFPTKPVRWIVPVPAGGSVDLVARIVGNKLSDLWSYPVIVDNRPGATGRVGTEIAANAPPGGYTQAFVISYTLTSDRSLYSKLPYDPEKSFTPITVIASTSQLLVINPALPPKTVRELIAYAKERPGKLNYGSAGVGSSTFLAMELFKSMTGTDIVHVAYKGVPLAANDVQNGQLALLFFNTPAALSFVKSGRLRAVGISTVQRSPLLPEVPTIAEAGVPGFQNDVWYGLLVPAATPSAIVRKVHGDVVAVIALPDIKKQLSALGADVVGSTPEEFEQLIKAETAKWARIIKAAGIRPLF